MKSFTPASALRALMVEANSENITEALYAVIDELPEDVTTLDDMSSRKILDLIFTALTGGPE